MATQQQIRDQITAQIVDALSKGTVPWRKPWRTDPNAGHPTNAVSRRAYSGVNPLLLQMAADRHGFTSKFWATYRQWQDLGGQVMARPANVKPGEWGTAIVFGRRCTKTTEDGDGEEVEKSFFVLRTYVVFNADQVLGSKVDCFRVGNEPVAAGEVEHRFEQAERVIDATGADIRYGGDRACYNFAGDFIQMPHRERFAVPEFYDTLFHELTHWSEHPARLNWDRKKPENSYALGELIAELGACYLAGELGLPLLETLPNHAAYLQSWLDKMKGDSRFIFTAAAQASRAVDFILSFSRVPEPEPEPALV
jgi:antirestriction protein ArdC